VYAIKYRLNLFSNFTYFLNDPTNGDQFEQADSRTVVGLTPRWVFNGKWDERQITHKLGLDARRDDINVALYDTTARDRRSPVRSDKVLRPGWACTTRTRSSGPTLFAASRACARISTAPAWTTISRELGNDERAYHLAQAQFYFRPFDKTEYFLNYGQGFHSNDARGTTITTATKVPALVKTRGEESGYAPK